MMIFDEVYVESGSPFQRCKLHHEFTGMDVWNGDVLFMSIRPGPGLLTCCCQELRGKLFAKRGGYGWARV